MIKEVLLAITLGALLGFGATGAFVAIQKSKPTRPATTVSSSVTSASPTPPESLVSPTPVQNNDTTTIPLDISQPENESVSTNSKVTIQGATLPNITLIVTTTRAYTTQSDNSGKFEIEIELETGANLITVSAIDNEGNQTDTDLTLTYSTSKF